MNLFKISIYTLLVFISFSGCKESQKSIDIATSIPIKTDNDKWADYINLSSDSISTIYADNAIKVLENGNSIIGNTKIKEYYHSTPQSIKSFQSDTVILANRKRKIEYEIAEYITQENRKKKQLIIWESNESNRKRVFEFTLLSNETNQDFSEIDSRRDLWMKLCNAHNAEALINEMYSENTIYFNHKPLVIGRKGLIQDYQYMNNEKYKLTLSPIIMDKVTDNFVFEIGQCAGSYNGKYIIIWKKNKSGIWEVYIDSNI